MEALGGDVNVKAELQYLRLDVQNLQLQLQCVHQEMQQLKEVVMAAIHPRNGEDSSFRGKTTSDKDQTADLRDRRNKVNVEKVDMDHGRRHEKRFGTECAPQSPQHAENQTKDTEANKESEAASTHVRGSIQNEALAQLGDPGNDALWEAEEMANERRGARQLQAIMRSTGMIIALDPESDTDTESDTVNHAMFCDDEVGGGMHKHATNGSHKADGVGDMIVSEHERLPCDSGSREEEEVGGGRGLQEWGPEVTSFLDHLGVLLERDGTHGRDGGVPEREEAEREEELEVKREGGIERGGGSGLGWEGGEVDVRLEDVMRRLAVLSARREGETPVLEAGGCGEDGVGRGVAERLALLAERGVQTQM